MKAISLMMLGGVGLFVASVSIGRASPSEDRIWGFEMGYYAGLSIFYPYTPVYCPTDSGMGRCESVGLYTPKSAPLPLDHKDCEWRDRDGKRYEWQPRSIIDERQKYLGTSICYFEDRRPRD